MTNAFLSSPLRAVRIPNCLICVWSLIAISASWSFAPAASPESKARSNNVAGVPGQDPHLPSIVDVQLGIAGFWKIGHATQARVTVAAGDSELNGSIEIKTVDSDGVGVTYQAACQIEAGLTQTADLVIRHGRTTRSMQVRLVDQRGAPLVERLIDERERGTILPVNQPWIVGIGSDMDLDQAALRSAKGLLPSYSTCEVGELSRLPRDADGYHGIDLLVISTLDWKRLERISDQQQQAIVAWVRRGGHLLVWLGENAEKVSQLSWLASMLPAQVQGTAPSVDPAILESYLSSQKRLGKLTCGRLAPQQCVIDLSLYTIDRQKLPVLLRSAHGFGQVQICAMDLDGPPLRDWPDRKLLLERLWMDHWDAPREARSRALDQSDYLGYDDLSGQTRAALDAFDGVRSGSLTLLAVIVCGLVALLGPFDYFVLSKAWRRPAWTWCSLIFWSLSGLVGVTLLARAWKPNHHAVNSIELTDYDYSTSLLRGRAFANHYAGRAGLFDFSATARACLSGSKTPPSQPSTAEAEPAELSWSGQPGHGLGGFDSHVHTDMGFPSYRVRRTLTANDAERTGNIPKRAAELIEVGIAFASSKSFSAAWNQSVELTGDGTAFSATGTSESLQGAWTNPMAEDLLDGWLLYRGWLYSMPSRVRPKGVFQVSASDIPKDLGRRLQRRQVVKDSDLSIPWDPSDRSDIGRLVEMLTLHRAAGGSGYTGLHHRYWKEWDLSQHLKLNRVIVFGRLSSPVIDWSVKSAEERLDVLDGRRSAYVRFVIPVSVANEVDSR